MKDPNKEKLPWWVELLFVQVGLPDNWLRSFLIKRKKLRNIVNENARFIGITGFTVFIMIYYNPIRREAILHNTCVSSSVDLITSTKDSTIKISKQELTAYAINFCYGGEL